MLRLDPSNDRCVHRLTVLRGSEQEIPGVRVQQEAETIS